MKKKKSNDTRRTKGSPMHAKNSSHRIETIKKIIVPILKTNEVNKAGIFGSVARKQAKKNSDIDILVEFRGRKSLFDLARLEILLEKKLSRKVDVLTYNLVHPLIRERIMKEEVRII